MPRTGPLRDSISTCCPNLWPLLLISRPPVSDGKRSGPFPFPFTPPRRANLTVAGNAPPALAPPPPPPRRLSEFDGVESRALLGRDFNFGFFFNLPFNSNERSSSEKDGSSAGPAPPPDMAVLGSVCRYQPSAKALIVQTKKYKDTSCWHHSIILPRTGEVCRPVEDT